MNVFVAGATGVLGRRVVSRLADRGHEVHGLARDDEGAAAVEARGGVPRRGDVLDPDSLAAAVDDDVEVIVHAATAIPTAVKPSEDDWARNDRVREEGARNLVAAGGPALERFVFPSVVWVARQPGGSAFDESADRNPDRATRSAAAVEAYLEETAGERDFDATILRCGFFYAPDAAHTRTWGRRLLSGDLPIVGGGLLGRTDAEMSFLHADDAGRAFAAAVDEGVTGLYHVVDDRPVTGADYFRTFADLLDAPEPSRVPGWLARFFVGKENVTTLTNPFPTTNETFTGEVDWEPEYATYREGLEQVVATWQEEETIRETSDGYEWRGE